MQTQSQAAAADYRPPSDMVHHVQQLQQSGFDDGQVRALASFVGDVVRDTMRPFIERVDQRFDDMQMRVDQRFDAVNERFDAVNERFDAVNERFNDMNRRVDRVETRLDNLEQRTGGLEKSVARLSGETAGVRRLEWLAIAMLGLGFVSVVTAIFLAVWIVV